MVDSDSQANEDKPKFSRKSESVFTDAFTINQDEQNRISDEIDRLANSLQSYPQPVQMSMPPVLLALDGVNGLTVQDLPLELDKQTLRKITGQVDGKKDSSHQLTLEQVELLMNEFTDPLAVLHSDNKDGLIILTSIQDTAGNPVISAIHLNKRKGRYVINELATAFSKDNFQSWINKRSKNIVYLKNEKSQNSVRQSQLQKQINVSLGVVHKDSASSQTILSPADVVNKFETGEKFSRGTGEGLTITQTRAILNERFGEKLIKALEAMGLITIMDSPPSWAEPDADGAYHNGKSYLFASNLTPETVVATFIHELGGHKGFQELMTPTAYDSLMRQFNRLVNQGNPIALAAKERAEAAESTLGEQQDEYLPYLLTQQTTLNAGRIQQSSVAKVVEQVYRAVKAWLYRTLSAHGFDGVASKLLQPKDIALLAERMIREMGNWTNPSNNTKAKGSQLSQLNTPLDPVNTRNILDRLLRVFAPKADAMRDSAVLRVRVVKSFVDLPLTIQEEAKRQGSNGSDIKGVFHNNTFYAVADNLYSAQEVEQTFFHEVYGHYGVRQLFGKSLNAQLNKLWRIIGGIDGMRKFAKEHGVDLTVYEKGLEKTDYSQETKNLILMDELLAHIAQTRKPSIKQAFNELMGKIRAWLRQKGFASLSQYNNQDLAHILTQARQAARKSVVLKNNEQAIRYSQSSDYKNDANRQIKEQLAKADKMIAEQGQLLAPNGKPSKLNRVQWAQVRTDNFKQWFGDWENDTREEKGRYDIGGVAGISAEANPRTGGNAEQMGRADSRVRIDGFGRGRALLDATTREPKVFFHGTKDNIEAFDLNHPNRKDIGWLGRGVYAASDARLANAYAKLKRGDGDENVMPIFVSVKNPYFATTQEKQSLKFATQAHADLVTQRAKERGHDGVVIQFPDGTIELVAFNPNQVKSAIGNTGEFSPTNPDIRFSRKAKNPITEGIKSAANDAKNSLPDPIAKSIDNFMAGRRLPSSDMANITAKTELGIYKRTIGTQQNTALQNADFKKVYDMAQRYLQHVAVDAYAALKVAPNLLGKLESWSDLKRDVKKIWPANFIKQKADRAAVASIIFDETLNNELLSDADILKALTRDQRQIYKEARDAIQVSLENTAKSEMVRKLLAAEAINWQTVESLINQDLPVGQFAQAIRDLVESRIGGFKNELEVMLNSDKLIKKAFKSGKVFDQDVLSKAQRVELKKAKTLKAQIETTEEALKSLNDVENRLGTLIEQGYAPLMRFGEYTLTVRDLDGKVKSFFMFESKSEQVRAVNTIVARYGKTVNLETDMISKEEFKQFAGMTPETVALFAKETGMDKDEAYQHYLKHAIPARSAMTRMIKRKGTEGFSDDIQRVVASFVMSNARMSAKNIYAAQIEKSIQDIESGKSVKDQAYVMKENVFNPKENFAQLRNFLFLWNLGGSIFFGLLNMTQPYMQTLPHLSQYVPIKEAFYAIIKGSGIAGSAMKNGTAPKGYEAEYNRAVREGVVDPQNVFMLSGVERGKTGASNSAWGVITHTMGLIAQVTESFNRKAVFIASLQVAKQKGNVWLKKKGFNSAYDFAKDTVDQTQGVYDKANRSNWANTSVGAPLMVFKQFSINYVEQMVRMWKKEAASGDEGKKAVFLMLALLASLSGMMGLPFIKDFLDVSETTAAFLGHPVNLEREARLMLGKDLADPLFNGVLNHFVFNNLGMDIQGRTGMPDLVPWSNALNPTLSAQGRINEFASIAGATGGLIEKGYDATQLIARGNIGTAALTLMPRSITSAFTGGKMAVTDEVMDSKGNKLFDTTWDEGLVKFIDANPKRMADLSRTKSLEWKDKSIQDYMTTSFKRKLIDAMMDKDQAEVNNLMVKVKTWNDARPHYPVYINLNNIAKAANKKDQTFDAREDIPKGMEWWKNERPEM